jgi:hypothetical protein
MMKNIFPVVIVFLFLFISSTSNANEFNVKGYETNIYWNVKQNRLRAWGDVWGGKPCRDMDIAITFANSRNGRRKTIYADIGDVRRGTRSPFRGKTGEMYDPPKNGWSVKYINLSCNE